MKKQALAALVLCFFTGALYAGFSLGRPAAVKKRVENLDAKVTAFQAAKAGGAAANRAPVISGIVILSPTVAAGGSTVLSASASDPDGDLLSYSWALTSGTVSGSSTSVSVSWVAPPSAGVYSIICTVSDSKGGSAFRVAAVTAVPHGTKKWEYATSSAVASSPAIGPDGTVYLTSQDGNLYAVSPSTGGLKWSYSIPLGAAINSSPALDGDNNIYFGADDGNLYSVSAVTGGLNWIYSGAADAINSSPAIGADGTVYFGSDDWYIYAVKPDGTPLWNYPTGDKVRSSPAVGSDGTVYVGSDDGSFYALDPYGSYKWDFVTGGPIRSSPALGADGSIYVGSGDGNVYAFDPLSGVQLGAFAVASASAVDAPLVIGTSSVVYAGTAGGQLYSLDINNSLAEEWASPFSASGPINSSPSVDAAGTIYVGSDDSNLYALNPDGTQKWVYAAGGAVVSTSIASDGTIYAGAADGKLYAFYGASALAASDWPKFHRNLGNTGR